MKKKIHYFLVLILAVCVLATFIYQLTKQNSLSDSMGVENVSEKTHPVPSASSSNILPPPDKNISKTSADIHYTQPPQPVPGLTTVGDGIYDFYGKVLSETNAEATTTNVEKQFAVSVIKRPELRASATIEVRNMGCDLNSSIYYLFKVSYNSEARWYYCISVKKYRETGDF